jgi:hypothetical protein
MSIVTDWIEENWENVSCETLKTLSDTGMIAGIANKFNPIKQLKPVLGVWNYVGIAATTAIAIRGCGSPEDIPQDPTYNPDDRCYALSGTGQLQCKFWQDGSIAYNYELSGANEATEIINISQIDFRNWRCQYKTVNNQIFTATQSTDYGTAVDFWLKPGQNSHCLGGEPDWTKPDGPIGPELPGPEYDDEDDPALKCKWTVTPVDAYVDSNGIYRTKYAVTPNDTRCGSPFSYWDSDRGPVIHPPGPEKPPPDAPNVFEIPTLTGTSYELYGWCEDPEDWGEEDGEQPVFTWEFEDQDAFQGIARRIDALADMLAISGLLRTPTCDACDEKTVLEGQWVTTRWESDEKMVDSGRRLRKLFRYRTKSTRNVGQLSAYWQHFTWRAGPVCVIHKGAWWGTPQVWAESEGEGKRVLRHAATEAGIDPDKTGQWLISSSGSPRYGMPGTMRVLKHQDFPWVASRDGADWPNILAKPRDP